MSGTAENKSKRFTVFLTPEMETAFERAIAEVDHSWQSNKAQHAARRLIAAFAEDPVTLHETVAAILGDRCAGQRAQTDLSLRWAERIRALGGYGWGIELLVELWRSPTRPRDAADDAWIAYQLGSCLARYADQCRRHLLARLLVDTVEVQHWTTDFDPISTLLQRAIRATEHSITMHQSFDVSEQALPLLRYNVACYLACRAGIAAERAMSPALLTPMVEQVGVMAHGDRVTRKRFAGIWEQLGPVWRNHASSTTQRAFDKAACEALDHLRSAIAARRSVVRDALLDPQLAPLRYDPVHKDAWVSLLDGPNLLDLASDVVELTDDISMLTTAPVGGRRPDLTRG